MPGRGSRASCGCPIRSTGDPAREVHPPLPNGLLLIAIGDLPSDLTACHFTLWTFTYVLRFPAAVRHDVAIDAWLNAQRGELRPLALRSFTWMRECGDDVRELMHDGHPTACVGTAAFGYVDAFTNHVNVGFFFGAALADPSHLLEGTGKRGRHVKLRPGRDVDVAALARLVEAAYVDIRLLLRGANRDHLDSPRSCE